MNWLRRTPLLGGIAIWLALVALGLGVLIRYSLLPGRPGRPPAVWPAASTLDPATDLHTLVMVVHPRCACSRATMSELAAIMTRCRLAARVLFVQPDGVGEPWAKSDLWRMADEIPGVEPILDRGGVEASRFGALTSGQAMLFDPVGRLVFSGGITGARGHAGPNRGRDAVVALVERRTGSRATPVFGCELEGPTSTPGQEAP